MNPHPGEKSTAATIVVILLGPPGSGKGTQAVQLTKTIGIPHISTGDLFRENMKNETPLGKEAKVFINAGKLVPDDLVLNMVYDRISRPDCLKGYLLDGFPRTINQAEAFDKKVSNQTKIIVFNLLVSDETIIKRASGRLTCKQCGSVYNKYYSPSKNEKICDKCSGELYQRADDKKEVVKERLMVYQTQTSPLIDYYQKKGVLTAVDGEASPEEVGNHLISLINSSSIFFE